MERYRTLLKLDEIRGLYANGEYEAAGALADTIREQKIKDMNDLFLLASVYRKCGNYRLAKRFLHRVYEKKSSWRVLEELMDVCLAEKNPQEAKEYLKVYSRLSGGDPRNYMYEYRIGRQLHLPDEELLPVLQTLKAEEYTEKYAYELAKLYHRLGRKQECQNECSDLILWFGEGTYVERAKVLMAYYRGELSAADIHAEAERRIREAKERQAREVAERRAYEERLQKEAEEKSLPKVAATEEELTAEETAGEEPMWAVDASILTEAEPEPSEENKPEQKEQKEACEEFEQFSLFEISAVAEEEFSASLEEAGEPEEAAGPEKAEAQEKVAEPEKAAEPEKTGEPEKAEAQEKVGEPEKTAGPEEAAETKDAVKKEIPVKTETRAVLSQPKAELTEKLSSCGLTLEGSLHAFARMENVRKQLIRMLEVMCFVRQKCCCLVITGEASCGKTTLGGYISKMFYALGLVTTPKIAKISAEKLNNINLEEKQEQLQGSCLIVENAGALKDEAARKLIKLGDKKGVLGAIILEDNLNEINKLLRKSPDCNRVFGTRVHLPKYGEEELLDFALERIYGKDYVTEEGVSELLRGFIRELLKTTTTGEQLKRLHEFVGSALKGADQRIEGEILSMALKGDFHEMGEMVVRKEDFKA